ncbi:MAG: hypothetical protein COU69_02270 [Candidatus Pacebacteria bacterium CG10_big_fil_rev_8_21_14_0_10_56_10]|nr:MAG: hypothetical protein COU69_02270 [Candidatus Pacebacteria bacterium CG10_big_fil_rev_8_21_14_0_10_56_10]
MKRGWFLGVVIVLAVVVPVLGLGAVLLGQGLPGDIVGPGLLTGNGRPGAEDAVNQQASGQLTRFEISPQPAELGTGPTGLAGLTDLSQPGFPLPPSPTIPPDGGQLDPSSDRLLVKTGSLSLVTTDLLSAVDQVRNVAERLDGLVTTTNITHGPVRTGYPSELPMALVTVRVPNQNFQQALDDIKAIANRVISESTNTLDQTEQKIDLDAQLNNLQATEEQLQQILGQAGTVNETLQVQRELTNTRTRIEQLTAQLDNLQGAADFSTIQVRISTEGSEQPLLDPSQPNLGQELKLAVQDAVKLYRSLFVTGLRWAVILLPVVPVGWLVKKWLIDRRRADRQFDRHPNHPSPNPNRRRSAPRANINQPTPAE